MNNLIDLNVLFTYNKAQIFPKEFHKVNEFQENV